MHEWFETPPGRYLLAWERAEFDRAVADIFGYHALQLGLPELDTLAANRMPHRWLGLREPHAPADIRRPALWTEYAALPFEAHSLDLVVLPHSLELNPDPHATLREVERVLVPEGKVVISCLNPHSLWGVRQRRAQLYRRFGLGELFLPEAGEFIGYRRLRDWLRLLNFEVETGNFGCWRPAFATDKWLGRFDWMDRAGERWWPILGAVYFIVATKRVRGVKLMARRWKPAKSIATAPVPLANRSRPAGSPQPELTGETV
ncbi:methyltransferase domain-containing protein [Ramlibacter sp. MAH-25]|jgi:SAM-dependent methyltransferase|uniref:Methyltransferase domain-containing protein n=2 Tax=Comamonadaceae TaxID=80864 RepID=A0A6N8IW25_9BURK|nr:methyltransferase domain-containing protein [Ramlibacter sp. CGMCC 1.13660]MVQ31179.1 methyltransferase domain-containing protein [Ramlibacter pinisoli]